MIHNLKSQNDFSGFFIIFNGSILNETPKTYGISHLIEHLKCKQFDSLYDEFDRYGISWNAYTSNNNVVFHMSGLDEYINNYKQQILDHLLKFDITKEQFETEKKIVIQEYKDNFQDQGDSHYSNMMRYYLGHYGPIGKYQALDSLTYENMLKYNNTYMTKPSMIINVSKYNEFKGYDDFSKFNSANFITSDMDIKLEKLADFNKSSILGYKLIMEDYPQIKFILEMLSGSLKSPFYNELREKRGLTYGVSTFVNPLSANQGIISTGIITDDNNVDEAIDIYKDILSNPEKYLTEKRFDIIKDYYTILFKKNEINRYTKIGHLISSSKWNIEPVLNDMTFNMIQDVYDKHFKFDDFRWSIDKKQFK